MPVPLRLSTSSRSLKAHPSEQPWEPPEQLPGKCLSPRAALEEEAWVRVDTCVCQVERPLGTGSFGLVWAAQAHAGPPLAIKEIMCHSQADLLNALFEGHLLRTFGRKHQQPEKVSPSGAALPWTSALGIILPCLVACDTLQLEPEVWRVRLAMTRVSGEPLDCFLKQKARARKDGGLQERRLSQLIVYACRLGQALLEQLAPALERVSDLAYHRDVNAHNIMIEAADRPVPQFGLVDFGLAVDAQCWKGSTDSSALSSRPSRVGQDGAFTWHHLDVGGDCRYWPRSAWAQFLLGWTEIEASPALSFEYQTQLDLHSLGLTALQVVVELLPLPSEMGSIVEVDEAPMPEICALQLAWEQYWAMVSPLHSRLIETFHGDGNWDDLKADCLQRQVHSVIAAHLAELRAALKDLSAACRQRTHWHAAGEMEVLSEALLLLISSGDGSRRAEGPGRWREVSLLLRRACSGSGEVCSSAACVLTPPAPSLSWRGCSNEASTASTASTAGSMCRSRAVHELPAAHAGGALTRLEPRDVLASAADPSTLEHHERFRGSPNLLPERPVASPGATLGGGHPRGALDDLQPQDPDLQPQDLHENLSRRLSSLKSKVQWLRDEMVKLDEKHADHNCKDAQCAQDANAVYQWQERQAQLD